MEPWDEGFIRGSPLSLSLDVLKFPVQKVSVGRYHKTHLFMTQWPHYLVRTSWFLLGKQLLSQGVVFRVWQPCDWMESLKLSTGPVPSPWLWVLSSMTHQTRVTAVQSRRQWFSEEVPIHICQMPHCLFSRFTFYSLKGFLVFPQIPLLLWTKFVSDAFNQRTPRDELAPSEIIHFLLGTQDVSASVCPPAHLPQKTP